ncbi:MAG: T9SS type A sorting domain-containing protein [Bacteroidetes bacterium]|nr:T9SS type A sorting domain-containing protein [Bacteroidota bacterium]
MKKIYTLVVLAAGIFTGVNAQQILNAGQNPQHAARQIRMKPGTVHSSARTVDPNVTPQNWSGWITYADAKDNDWGGGVSVLNANYLFPDSNVLGNFGTWDYVWIHSLGDVLDVASPSLNNYYGPINGYAMSRTDAYSIDSMEIVYSYARNYSNPGVVDTLIVYLYSNGTSANLYNNGFIGSTAANYGTDTVTFKGMHYNGAVNMPSQSSTSYVMPTGMVTFKLPLTIADTSVTYWGAKDFSTNGFSVPAGKLAAVGVDFKPGYPYSTGDTLDTQLNSFYFASYEEGGANTYPLYLDCNYQASSCDYGCSFITRTQERYNETGNSWNGNYIPKYAFTQAYSLENHLFSYKITTPPTGIASYTAPGLSLGQNYPNPANGNTMVNYSIADAGNIVVTVCDVTGQQVMIFNEGHKAAGNYQLEMNTQNLNAGVYFYTLNVDGKQTTRRMIVAQ